MRVAHGLLTYLVPLLLILTFSGCARPDEQAVRHAVTAEMIMRYHVNEDKVRLVQIENSSGAWVVRTEVSSGGRVEVERVVTCRVERSVSPTNEEARWTLTTIEEQKHESGWSDGKR